MNSTTSCEDGPAGSPADATDCRLTIRMSSTSATLRSVGSCRPPPPIIEVDACSLSGRDACGMWCVSETDMPELGGGLDEYGAGSDDSTCMPPYCSAAISWGERGRDLRLSFCRRFWNQICIGGVQAGVSTIQRKRWRLGYLGRVLCACSACDVLGLLSR